MPNDIRHRPPLPEKQNQGKAGEQNIGAALDWFRDIRVHQFLKPGRAMTLCCKAKMPRR